MQKLLLLTILTSFLSCTSNELTTVQCSVNLDEAQCFCRNYKFSKEYVGPVGSSWEDKIERCHLMVGFPLDKYSEVANFWEYTRQQINKPKKD